MEGRHRHKRKRKRQREQSPEHVQQCPGSSYQYSASHIPPSIKTSAGTSDVQGLPHFKNPPIQNEADSSDANSRVRKKINVHSGAGSTMNTNISHVTECNSQWHCQEDNLQGTGNNTKRKNKKAKPYAKTHKQYSDLKLTPSASVSEHSHSGVEEGSQTRQGRQFQHSSQWQSNRAYHNRGGQQSRQQRGGDRGGRRSSNSYQRGPRGDYHGNSRGNFRGSRQSDLQLGSRGSYQGSGSQGSNSFRGTHRGGSRGSCYNFQQSQIGHRSDFQGNSRRDYRSSRSDDNQYSNRSDGCDGSRHGYGRDNQFGNRGKNRRGRHGKGNGRAQSTVTTSESKSESNSDQPNTADDDLEIPGFYYDPEKQRYFQIMPDHVGSVSEHCVTKGSIARKKAEAQRQADLAVLSSSTKAQLRVSSTVSAGKTRNKPSGHSVASLLLNGYQRGEVDSMKLHRTWLVGLASNIRQTGTSRFTSAFGRFANVEHMKQMEVNEDHNRLLCLWSVAGTMLEHLQLIKVKETKRTRLGELALEFSPSNATFLQSLNKITSLCWSDFSQYPGKSFVLYTTMCHTGQTQSLAFIRNLDPSNQEPVHFFDFNLGMRMTWASAWNYHKQQFGVGTEKGCLVIDINTRQLWQFKTNKSDALSQIFSKEDGGNSMYTGTRGGSILKYDLRSSSTMPANLMSHQSSVCCLRLSPEERFLYASDFSGKINKWDLRMNNIVLTYDGLFNKQSKLPFRIDETQSLLYGAGQDCYTKIWCLNTGKLLHSIPPPYEASVYAIPAVQFSTRWAKAAGNVGLVMGANKYFYLYGPNFQNEGK